MDEPGKRESLRRIADALEQLSPPAPEPVGIDTGNIFLWDGSGMSPVAAFEPVALDLLTAIDDQKDRLLVNTQRHARGHAAHDILLWGARGMGKSALVKASIKALNEDGQDIALVEANAGMLESLPHLFRLLGDSERHFVLFIDDISFADDSAAPRLLRSMLEGGAEQRPENVRLYVTSNRRHIVARSMAEQDDPVNPRDVVDDKLALSDRFGLRLGFHAASQDDYLAMVSSYAAAHGLEFEPEDALLWSRQHGSRSGRVAWQYLVELAGRAGRSLG